jgi:hypothetical protein
MARVFVNVVMVVIVSRGREQMSVHLLYQKYSYGARQP